MASGLHIVARFCPAHVALPPGGCQGSNQPGEPIHQISHLLRLKRARR